MEMELGSAIVGAVSIAVVALPVVLMSRNRRKKGKHFNGLLTQLAAQHDCKIDQQEIAGNFAIGLDATKNFVFFCKETEETVDKQVVDLGKIRKCEVLKTSRIVKVKEENQRVIDRIELDFIPGAKGTPETKLEFFNADLFPQLSGELQSAEKWSQLINGRLKRKK